jgi:hypothetical protein
VRGLSSTALPAHASRRDGRASPCPYREVLAVFWLLRNDCSELSRLWMSCSSRLALKSSPPPSLPAAAAAPASFFDLRACSPVSDTARREHSPNQCTHMLSLRDSLGAAGGALVSVGLCARASRSARSVRQSASSAHAPEREWLAPLWLVQRHQSPSVGASSPATSFAKPWATHDCGHVLRHGRSGLPYPLADGPRIDAFFFSWARTQADGSNRSAPPAAHHARESASATRTRDSRAGAGD